MKRAFKMLLAAGLAAAMVLPVAACGSGGGEEGGGTPGGGSEGGKPDGGTYSITYDSSEHYDFNSRTIMATTGETVTVTVETEPYAKVDAVLANDVECAKAGGGYIHLHHARARRLCHGDRFGRGDRQCGRRHGLDRGARPLAARGRRRGGCRL